MLGDIVERDIHDDTIPEFSIPEPPKGPPSIGSGKLNAFSGRGFPEIKKLSAFKNKRKTENNNNSKNSKSRDSSSSQPANRQPEESTATPLTESERIHLENIKYLQSLTEEQKAAEKEELMESMDPKVLMGLLKVMEKREQKMKQQQKQKLEKNEIPTTDNTIENKNEEQKEGLKDDRGFQGYGDVGLTVSGDWIGGFRDGEKGSVTGFDDEGVNRALSGLKVEPQPETIKKREAAESKTVRFKEEEEQKEVPQNENTTHTGNKCMDFEELDEIAPPSYQINQEVSSIPPEEAMGTVHFPKPDPSTYEQLDINSPDFEDKLHEKYFPDLPRDPTRLEWTQPLKPITLEDTLINTVNDLRFDFRGDLVIQQEGDEINTRDGLHHHSEKSNLAGYTLKELAHLSRSQFPGQRCLAIRTLGRILYKLGQNDKYYLIEPEFVDDDGEVVDVEEGQRDIEEGRGRFRELIWDLIKELRVVETLQEFTEDLNLSVRSYSTEALWMWQRGKEEQKKDSDK